MNLNGKFAFYHYYKNKIYCGLNGSKKRREIIEKYKIKKKIHVMFRIRKALENRTNMEDDRVAILEAQLSQAKLIAEEADRKYEEVDIK